MKHKIRLATLFTASAAVVAAPFLFAETPPRAGDTPAQPPARPAAAPRDERNLSLRNQVRLSIDKGLAFLKSRQKEDGSWPDQTKNPSTTAFPLMAFQQHPEGEYGAAQNPFMQRGYDFLRQQAKPNGGIYQKGLATINTALCLSALCGAKEAKDEPLLKAARDYLLGLQVKQSKNPAMVGGFGYGEPGEKGQADLHNTYHALEGLEAYRATHPAADGSETVDKDLQAAIAFIARCQNLPETNKEPWVSGEAAEKGGFVYFPGGSAAGEIVLPGRGKGYKSYGSMGYCGLLSLAYAGVPPEDPRLVAAKDWLTKNFSVEENPGMKDAGLFAYYHAMAKGLATAGTGELKLPDGRAVDWAKELALKLVRVQKGDGSWVNDNGEWMENDAVLVTSYAVIALNVVYRRL